jgi:hypothetical protein
VVVVVVVVVEALPCRVRHVQNHDVVEIAALHVQNHDVVEIAALRLPPPVLIPIPIRSLVRSQDCLVVVKCLLEVLVVEAVVRLPVVHLCPLVCPLVCRVVEAVVRLPVVHLCPLVCPLVCREVRAAQVARVVRSWLRVVVDVLEAVQVDVVGPAVCGLLYFLRVFFWGAVVVRAFVSAWKMLVVACLTKGPGYTSFIVVVGGVVGVLLFRVKLLWCCFVR